MANNPEQDKLNAMAARIRQAEIGTKPAPETPLESADTVKASRIGFDFVATVLACAGIGWLIDRAFASSPWGILVMLLIGFVGGIANVYRALGGYGPAVGWKKKTRR